MHNVDALGPLVQCTVQTTKIGGIGARQLANIAYGVAHVDGGESLGALLITLAAATYPHVQK